MTSPTPLLFNTYYHIYNRGVNRENIFIEERNYDHFYSLYHKHIDPVAETFAYCLMRNHFHTLVRIRTEEEILPFFNEYKPGGSENQRLYYPSKKYSDFFNAYSKSINAAYQRVGSLFQHPFGRVAVTKDVHFWRVIAYIHQNPQKHCFVEDFRDWKYSSYGIILSDPSIRVNRGMVLEWFGDAKSYIDLHNERVSEKDSQAFSGVDLD